MENRGIELLDRYIGHVAQLAAGNHHAIRRMEEHRALIEHLDEIGVAIATVYTSQEWNEDGPFRVVHITVRRQDLPAVRTLVGRLHKPTKSVHHNGQSVLVTVRAQDHPYLRVTYSVPAREVNGSGKCRIEKTACVNEYYSIVCQE